MKQVIYQNGEESVDNDGTQKEPLNLQKHGGIQSLRILLRTASHRVHLQKSYGHSKKRRQGKDRCLRY